MLKEFKPTLFFLLRFFAVYFILSFAYGWYIKAYDTGEPPQVDPFTSWVTQNCTRTASLFGVHTSIVPNDHLEFPTADEQTFDSIIWNGYRIISVEEGCNGLNIMIIFLAFVVGFGGKLLNMLIFIPAGLIFIHLANIFRLLLLAWLNMEWGANAFHFFHKYGFTAFIYLAVLFLWYLWVMKFSGRRLEPRQSESDSKH